MSKLGERAIVLGASMGGLLAARVLADFYETVTVLERDVLTDDPANRRGVPQGRHPHALLARGAQTLGELFPEILDELVADGAPGWDDGEYSRLYISFVGHLGGLAADAYEASYAVEVVGDVLSSDVLPGIQQHRPAVADHLHHPRQRPGRETVLPRRALHGAADEVPTRDRVDGAVRDRHRSHHRQPDGIRGSSSARSARWSGAPPGVLAPMLTHLFWGLVLVLALPPMFSV